MGNGLRRDADLRPHRRPGPVQRSLHAGERGKRLRRLVGRARSEHRQVRLAGGCAGRGGGPRTSERGQRDRLRRGHGVLGRQHVRAGRGDRQAALELRGRRLGQRGSCNRGRHLVLGVRLPAGRQPQVLRLLAERPLRTPALTLPRAAAGAGANLARERVGVPAGWFTLSSTALHVGCRQATQHVAEPIGPAWRQRNITASSA